MNWNECLECSRNYPRGFTRKSPPPPYDVSQNSNLPSSPPLRVEDMGTCFQPLIKSPLQQYRESTPPRASPKTSATMAYLCRLNTPLRRTEYLNAEGNCVRARQSVVEMSDLNTANNCTTQCPMIAEHCTNKQHHRRHHQHHHRHHECNSCKDECYSLGPIQMAVALSAKVKGTPKCCQLNTSTTHSNHCLQVCQPPVEIPKCTYSVCPGRGCRASVSKCETGCSTTCDFEPPDMGNAARCRIEQRRMCKSYPSRPTRWPYGRKITKNYCLKNCPQETCKMSLEQCCQPRFGNSRKYFDAWHLKNCCNHRQAYRSCAMHSCPRLCPCHLFI